MRLWLIVASFYMPCKTHSQLCFSQNVSKKHQNQIQCNDISPQNEIYLNIMLTANMYQSLRSIGSVWHVTQSNDLEGILLFLLFLFFMWRGNVLMYMSYVKNPIQIPHLA